MTSARDAQREREERLTITAIIAPLRPDQSPLRDRQLQAIVRLLRRAREPTEPVPGPAGKLS
jgi:hypothetical protein